MGIEKLTGTRITLPLQPPLIFNITGTATQTQKETPEERRQRLRDNKNDKQEEPTPCNKYQKQCFGPRDCEWVCVDPPKDSKRNLKNRVSGHKYYLIPALVPGFLFT